MFYPPRFAQTGIQLHEKPPMSARLAPAVFVLLWSTGYIASKLGAPYAEPFTFLSLRFLAVLAILLPACLMLRAPWPRGRMALHAGVAGVLIHGLYLGGTFWAIRNGMPAGVAALIVSLQPVTTALLALPLLGERIKPLHWLGLVVGLAGVGLVIAPRLGTGTVGELAGIRPATLLASGLSLITITLGTIYQKRAQAHVDLRTGTVLQFAGALAVSSLIAFATETRTVVWSRDFIIALAWLVLVLSIISISLLMVMIRRSAVSQVAALFYLVPVVTVILAFVLFGETLTLVQLAGMGLVTGAVMLISRSR